LTSKFLAEVSPTEQRNRFRAVAARPQLVAAARLPECGPAFADSGLVRLLVRLDVVERTDKLLDFRRLATRSRLRVLVGVVATLLQSHRLHVDLHAPAVIRAEKHHARQLIFFEHFKLDGRRACCFAATNLSRKFDQREMDQISILAHDGL
jgi:hypothetical protein